jgi:hypothetical protein
MGLRSSSSWDSRNPRPASQPWADNSGKGLTPAQERMDKAASPLAGQQRSEVTPDLTAEQRQAQVQQQEQQKEAAAQERKQGYNPVEAQIEQATSRLTTFSSNLRAQVNQFLKGASEGVGFQESAGPQYVLNPATGMTELVFEDDTADVSGVAEAKRKEQEKIKEYLKSSGFVKEVAGKLYAKDFSEALQPDEEKLGFDTKSKIDSTVSLLDRLEQLVQSGAGGSSEARAIEQELETRDETGMVSGLRKARNDYSRIMGGGEKAERWYSGEGGEGFTALELAQIEGKKIKDEVEKALNFSTGMFSGDFASNIQSMFDAESADVKASREREAAAHTELQKGFQAWADTYGGDIKVKQDEINNKLKSVAQSIAAEASANADTATASIWMDAMSEGDLTGFFSKMINDPNSGLSSAERKKLGTALSSVMGGANDPMSAMHSLAYTGVIRLNLPKADGTTETTSVKPSAREKMNLINIMQDPTLTSEERNAKLKDAIDNLQVGSGKLSENMARAMDVIQKTGVDEAGISTFKNAVNSSLKSYAGSLTEAAFNRALGITDEEWAKLGAKERTALVKQKWDAMTPEQRKNLADNVEAQVNAARMNMESNINTKIETITGAVADANNALSNAETAQNNLTTQATEALNTAVRTVEDSAFLRNAIKNDYTEADFTMGEKQARADYGYSIVIAPVAPRRDPKASALANQTHSLWGNAFEEAANANYPGGARAYTKDMLAASALYAKSKKDPSIPTPIRLEIQNNYIRFINLGQALKKVEMYADKNPRLIAQKSTGAGEQVVNMLTSGSTKKKTWSWYDPPTDTAQKFAEAFKSYKVPALDIAGAKDTYLKQLRANPMQIPEYAAAVNSGNALGKQITSLKSTIPLWQQQISNSTKLRDGFRDDKSFSPQDVVNTALKVATGTRGSFSATEEHVGKSGEVLLSGNDKWESSAFKNPNISYANNTLIGV